MAYMLEDASLWEIERDRQMSRTGGSSLHQQLLEISNEYIKHSYNNVVNHRKPDWNRSELEYYAAVDWEEIEWMKNQGIPTFDDPFCLPTTHTFISSHVAAVFQLWRERSPRFSLRARQSAYEQQVQMMEALIDYQQQRNRMDKIMLYRFISAALYGYSPRKTVWDNYRQINSTYVWDPFLFFWDPYVPVTELQRGRFVGFQSTENSVNLTQAGIYHGLDKLKPAGDAFLKTFGYGLERGSGWKGGSYRDRIRGITEPYLSEITPAKIGRDTHIVHEVWCKLIPSKFKNMPILPGMDPDDYHMCVISVANGESVIRFDYSAFPFEQFPSGVFAPLADGLSIAPPGLTEISSGVQRYINWLASSRKEDVQRNLNSVWIYDPSYIDRANLQNRYPGMNIPIRPEAFGLEKLDRAMMQLETRDVTRGHLEEIVHMLSFIERDTGATDPVQGGSAESQKERTATELSIITRAAQGRHGMIMGLYDQQDNEDLVMQMVANTQEFMSQEVTLKLTGDIAARLKSSGFADSHLTIAPGAFVTESGDPIEMDYVPFDPKHIVYTEHSAEILRGLLDVALSVPVIGQRLDVFELFREITRQSGVRDFDRFVIDVPGPQEQAEAQQMGMGAPMGAMPPAPPPEAVPANGSPMYGG